jgi:hypothetical protein
VEPDSGITKVPKKIRTSKSDGDLTLYDTNDVTKNRVCPSTMTTVWPLPPLMTRSISKIDGLRQWNKENVL